jgi:hypothetical protein
MKPFTFLEFQNDPVRRLVDPVPTGGRREVRATTMGGAVDALMAALKEERAGQTLAAPVEMGPSGITVYPEGERGATVWVYESLAPARERFYSGDYVLVKRGAKGCQVACVYRQSRTGTYLVRKWSALGRQWTGGVYVEEAAIVRKLTVAEATELVAPGRMCHQGG